MVVLGQDVVRDAGKRNKPLRAWLVIWVAAVSNVKWSSIDDVRRTYPSADGVKLASGTTVTIFNVKGNQYRLLAWIDYASGVVEALEVITHSDYDKDLWKARY